MSDWRKTRAYRLWRAKVIRRDKRCVVCGTIKNRHAHHIFHATYFPDHRFSVKNGVTLCADCHRQFNCNYHKSFREKCDSYSWHNFLALVDHFREVLNPPRIADILLKINQALYEKYIKEGNPWLKLKVNCGK